MATRSSKGNFKIGRSLHLFAAFAYKKSQITFFFCIALLWLKGGSLFSMCLGWNAASLRRLMNGIWKCLMVGFSAEKERSFGDVLTCSLLWGLWKESNSWVFEDKCTSFVSFWLLVQYNASWWCTIHPKFFCNYGFRWLLTIGRLSFDSFLGGVIPSPLPLGCSLVLLMNVSVSYKKKKKKKKKIEWRINWLSVASTAQSLTFISWKLIKMPHKYYPIHLSQPLFHIFSV